LHFCPQFFLHHISEGRATVTAIDQYAANLFQIVRAPFHRLQGTASICHSGGRDRRYMRKTLRIHSDVTLDPRNLLARVVTLFSIAGRVLPISIRWR
jgi:hypothetical protein